MCSAPSFSKRLQGNKDKRTIGRGAGEAETSDRKIALILRYIRCSGFDFAHCLQRVLQGSALRRLHQHDQVPFVVFRNKSARDLLVEPIRPAQRQQKGRKRRIPPPAKHAPDGRLIPICARGYYSVEAPEKATLRPLAMMPQENSGKRRRERQRVKRGNGHRKSNRQRKLPEQDACS